MKLWTALTLLLLGLTANYLWTTVSPRQSGIVYTASGAIFRVWLLLLLVVAYRATAVRLVAALLVLYDLTTAVCQIAYLIKPWVSVPGESCTARLHTSLGLIGAVLALWLILWIVRSHDPRKSR